MLIKRKATKIALLVVQIFLATIIVVLIINETQSLSKNDSLEASKFEWNEVFDQSNSEISKEAKDQMYVDSLESALKNAILDGIKECNDANVEIDKTDQITNVTVTLNMVSEADFDVKDIDGIVKLLQNSIGDLPKENIEILIQN